MAQVYKGQDLMVFSGSTAMVAGATNHTLSITSSQTSVSCKDLNGSWEANETTSLAWSISTSALYLSDNTDFDAIFTAMATGAKLDIVFGLRNNPSIGGLVTDGGTIGVKPEMGSGLYKGKVVVTSITLNTQNGENATYDFECQGYGALTKVTA